MINTRFASFTIQRRPRVAVYRYHIDPLTGKGRGGYHEIRAIPKRRGTYEIRCRPWRRSESLGRLLADRTRSLSRSVIYRSASTSGADEIEALADIADAFDVSMMSLSPADPAAKPALMLTLRESGLSRGAHAAAPRRGRKSSTSHPRSAAPYHRQPDP